MELVIFMGLQATGKSAFYRERFYRTHVRLNLDMLKTRHRERLLLDACISGKAKTVIDNTNVTKAERSVYIGLARPAGFAVVGYFFESRVTDALARNAGRPDDERVPDLGIRGASGRLELPSLDEGFDRLHFVRIDPAGGFIVDDWRNEI